MVSVTIAYMDPMGYVCVYTPVIQLANGKSISFRSMIFRWHFPLFYPGDFMTYGGFHSHGGIPIAGWFLLGKMPSRKG